MLLRAFCISIVCIGCSLARAQELPSLHNWTVSHPDWKDNKAELAYVASRCATMFETIGHFFAMHPVHEEQRRSANAYLSHSDILHASVISSVSKAVCQKQKQWSGKKHSVVTSAFKCNPI